LSLSPIICKVCESMTEESRRRFHKNYPLLPILRRPEIIIGESDKVRQGKETDMLVQHIAICAAVEVDDKKDTEKRHAQELQLARMNGQNFMTWLISRLFTLPAEFEAPHEKVRALYHAATRKTLKVTDEQLARMPADFAEWEDCLKDLRDRYEEIGRYDPVQ